MIASARFLSMLAWALALGLALSCGGGGDDAPAPSADGGTEEIVVAEAGESLELPDGFPSDVPRHPRARVVSYRTLANGDISVNLMTEDRVEDVLSFYTDSLAAQGWSTSTQDDGSERTIFADKGNRMVTTVVSRDAGGVSVDMVIATF